MHTEERKNFSNVCLSDNLQGGKVGGKPISLGNHHFQVSHEAEEQSYDSQ
jgi:hypothetical protein